MRRVTFCFLLMFLAIELQAKDVDLPEKATPEEIVVPIYAPIAQLASIQGMVELRLAISESGKVRDVVILEGQPMGLSEVAMNAARLWRFSPGASEAEVAIQMEFILIPLDDSLPWATVVNPHHIRVYAWEPTVIHTSHWTPASGKRLVRLEERPFLRLVRSATEDYRGTSRDGIGENYLEFKDSCAAEFCNFCLPRSALWTEGSSHPLERSHESGYVCVTALPPR